MPGATDVSATASEQGHAEEVLENQDIPLEDDKVIRFWDLNPDLIQTGFEFGAISEEDAMQLIRHHILPLLRMDIQSEVWASKFQSNWEKSEAGQTRWKSIMEEYSHRFDRFIEHVKQAPCVV